MIELIKHPITVTIGIIIIGVVIKMMIDAWEDKHSKQVKKNGKKKSKEYGKKARDFGKTTMRLLRRKALRKSLENGDWKYK